jgi:hypothetical protein
MAVVSHDVSACLLDPVRTSFDKAAAHDGYSPHRLAIVLDRRYVLRAGSPDREGR